jgi:hypothetical protein
MADRKIHHTNKQQAEWLNSLDWLDVGPKLVAALEEIDWALSSGKTNAAKKIIDRIFREIGRPDENAASID